MSAPGYRLDRPTALSCPECGGTVHRSWDAPPQYRCHIGHVLGAESMLRAQQQALEKQLGSCLALLNERAELCRQLIDDARAAGLHRARLETARQQSLQYADAVREILDAAWVLPETEGDGDPP